MANVFNLVKEALNDNEPNEQIEATLNKMLNNQTEYFLSHCDKNMQLMLALVSNAIRSANVNVTELTVRAKLMNKFMIRDCFQYYLHLLMQIIQLCQAQNLSLGQIDTIMEILKREAVITPFVHSHWACANIKPNGLGDQDVIEQRYQAISKCAAFLGQMEDDHHEI